jgi:hypothetical protein
VLSTGKREASGGVALLRLPGIDRLVSGAVTGFLVAMGAVIVFRRFPEQINGVGKATLREVRW